MNAFFMLKWLGEQFLKCSWGREFLPIVHRLRMSFSLCVLWSNHYL